MMRLNKCLFVGRLTRDPESRSFASGGSVTSFGMAVNNRKKDPATGKWEDDPLFLDVSCWKQVAEYAETLRKGDMVLVEGELRADRWVKDGQRQEKIKLTAFAVSSDKKVAKAVQDDYLGNPPPKQEDMDF